MEAFVEEFLEQFPEDPLVKISMEFLKNFRKNYINIFRKEIPGGFYIAIQEKVSKRTQGKKILQKKSKLI